MAIKRSKRIKPPKMLSTSIKSQEEKVKKPLDMKKVKLYGGVGAGVATLVIGASLIMSWGDGEEIAEPPTSDPNAGSEWGQDPSMDGGFGDWGSSEGTFDENNYAPRDGDLSSIEVGSLTEEEQLAMSSKWYSLYSDGEKIDASPTMSDTASSAYSKVMGKINSEYSKAEQKKKQDEQKYNPVGGGSNPLIPSNDGSYSPIIGGSSPVVVQNPNTGGDSGGNTGGIAPTPQPNEGSPSPQPSPTQPSLIEKIGVSIDNGKINNIDSLKGKGVEVIEGGSLQQKLFDLMDNLTSEIIIDTQNKHSEEDVVSWITNEYSNKLLVTQLDYGYLDESKRHVYVEVDYNVTKAQLKEMKTFAEKQVKSIKSNVDSARILAVGKVIADLGSYSKQGKQSIFSPYTLFKHKYGVCQAYTSMGKIMLDALGIKNGIATGVLNDESHSWNVVELEGKVYHVDFTLYDTKGSASYLSIVDKDITKDRILNRIIWN